MNESHLVNEIIRSLYPVVELFRTNAGVAYTKNGNMIRLLPQGFSDLFGVIDKHKTVSGHAEAVFIECKVGKNKATEPQKVFLQKMADRGCICGVAYSVEDAWNLIAPYIKQH